jgi:hypothetical protein
MAGEDPIKHVARLIFIMLIILGGVYYVRHSEHSTDKIMDYLDKIVPVDNGEPVVNTAFVHKENGYCYYTYNSAFAMYYFTRRLSEVNNPSYLKEFRKSASKYLGVSTIPETWSPSSFWSLFEYMSNHYRYDFYRTPQSNPENCDVLNFPYSPHELLTIRQGVCFDYALMWAMLYAAYGKTGTIVYLAEPYRVGHAFFVYKDTFVGEDQYIYIYSSGALWSKGLEWHHKKNWTEVVLMTVTPGGGVQYTSYNWNEFKNNFSP